MMNIQPTGSFSATHPNVPGDPFWCQQANQTAVANKPSAPEPATLYAPNAAAGKDIRDKNVCPQAWRLTSSMLDMFIKGDANSKDNMVACFSNCGLEEYPAAPALTCTDASNPKCGAWRTYCCQDSNYGGNKCTPKGCFVEI
jgi:hypothetical protein